MADDYSISAEITADTSGFEKGINKAQKASKNLSKSISGVIQGLGKGGLVGALGAVGLASSGLSATLGSVVKIARKVSETMNECTNAYKNQIIAERALDTAIKNNPFVTGSSAKALKEYASEMQKVTNYGDEELIPMMANLVSLGRTESETMQIMTVALDMASGMGISLDSAITQLNATLNGNIGRLGQQNKELKNLTEEELKSGKAVEILGKKFKGLSSATVDTSKQLQNIKGDFKEAIGQFTLPSSDMWNKFWAGFYQSGIDVINKFNDYLDTQIIGKKILKNLNSNARAVASATGNTVESVLSDMRYLKEQISFLSDSEIETLQKTLEKQKDRTEAEERILTITRQIAQSRKLQLVQDKKDAEAEAKKAQALTEQEELENGIAKLKDDHIKKIAEQKRKWENLKKVTGEEVSLEEKLKFYQDDLVAIMTEAGGQISTNNQYYKDQMNIINGILAELEKVEKRSVWDEKLLEQRIELLETEKEKAIQNAEEIGNDTLQIETEYDEKILQLKLKKLTDEKNKELNAVGVSEEDKLKILEFYSNEEALLYEELKKKKKKDNEEEEKNEKSKFSVILGNTKDFANKTAQVFGKVAKTIGNAFSAIGNFVKNTFSAVKNIFSKLFDFNVSDMLDSLLKVEDAILTFFVETLPKLPSFFESAFSSVLVLIQSLINNIDWDKVKTIFESIINTFVKYAPQILSGIVELFTRLVGTLSSVLVENAPAIVSALGEMFFTILEALPSLISNFLEVAGTYLSEIGKYITENGERLTNDLSAIITSLVEGISTFIENGGWKNVLSAILTIQKALETAVTDNLEEIVDTIIDALPDLIQFLIESIVSASKALSKVIKPIIKLIMAVIDALLEVLLSDEVINAGLDVFSSLIEAIIGEFIPKLASLLLKFLPKIINSVLKIIPKLIVAIVKGLVNGFIKTDWVQVVKDMFTGFVEGVKNFFGIHSPSTLFEEFGGYIIQGFWNGIKNLGSWLWENVIAFFTKIIGGISDFFGTVKEKFSNIGDSVKSAFSNFGEYASTAWSNIKNAFGNVGDWFKQTFSNIGDNVKNAFSKFGEHASNAWSNIKNAFGNVGNWFKETFSNIGSNVKNAFANFGTFASNAWSNIKSGFGDVGGWFKSTFSNAVSGIQSAFSGLSSWFSNIGNNIRNTFSNVASNMKTTMQNTGDYIKSLATTIGSGLSSMASSVKSGLSDFGSKIAGFFGYANGTINATKGIHLVGEQGPELVKFNGGEQVLNTHNTQKALEGVGGKSNTFNVTFNNLQDTSAFAMIQQLKQYNRQMAINGVI